MGGACRQNELGLSSASGEGSFKVRLLILGEESVRMKIELIRGFPGRTEGAN